MFLRQIPLHWVRMLRERITLKLMSDGCTQRLGRQQGSCIGGELHVVGLGELVLAAATGGLFAMIYASGRYITATRGPVCRTLLSYHGREGKWSSQSVLSKLAPLRLQPAADIGS